MNNRPDIPIVAMASTALGAAVASGAAAAYFGFALDTIILMANLGFALCCYLTTLRFPNVLYQVKLNELLRTDAKREIDLSDLFVSRLPTPRVAAERIWANRPVSRCVLLKAYAADTKTIHDRIINAILFSLFPLLVTSAMLLLATRFPVTPAVAPSPGTGIATSVLALIVSFIFAIVRVYLPMLEVAQRNLNLLSDP